MVNAMAKEFFFAQPLTEGIIQKRKSQFTMLVERQRLNNCPDTSCGFWRYFLLGAGLWFAVDFTTAFAPNVRRWVSFMPTIFLFYLGFPLVFAFLIYRRRWTDRQLIVPMLLVLVIVEILFSHNILLYTFPLMLVFIPAATAIYSLLTFMPRWIVDGQLSAHRKTVLLLVLVWFAIAALSIASRVGGGH